MARIVGVELPNKRVVIALTYIFGIGNSTAKKILDKLKIDHSTKANDLVEDEINKINKLLNEEYTLEGDLKNEISSYIKRLIQINSYRGQRHRKKLPVRGQRTKTNARTRKGKGKAIANKKIAK